MNHVSIKTLIFTLFLTSCSPNYSLEECEDLSQRGFKGIPSAAHRFERHCKNKPVVYTAEKCQRILQDFILTGSVEEITRVHGEKASGCLSQNDLNKFSKH